MARQQHTSTEFLNSFLILLFIASLLASLLLVIVGVRFERAQQISSRVLLSSEQAFELDISTLRIISILQQYTDTPSQLLLEELEEERADSARLREQLRTTTTLPVVLQQLNAYEELLPARTVAGDELIAQRDAGASLSELSALRADLYGLDLRAREVLAAMIAEERTHLEQTILATENLRQVLSIIFLISILFIATVPIFLAYRLSFVRNQRRWLLLIIGLLSLVVLLVAVGWRFSSQLKRLNQVAEAEQYAYLLDIEALRIISLLQAYTDQPHPSLIAEIEHSRSLSRVRREQLRASTQDANVRALLDDYEAALPARIALAERLISARDENAPFESLVAIRRERAALDLEAREYLSGLIDRERVLVEAQKRQVSQWRTRFYLTTALILLVLIACALWLSYTSIQLVKQSIRRLEVAIRRIGGERVTPEGTQLFDDLQELEQIVGSIRGEVDAERGRLNELVERRTASLQDSQKDLEGKLRELEKTKLATTNVMEDIEEERAKFKGTFESSSIGIALVGTDGSWIEVNEALPKIVGYSRDELLGMTFQDITHPEDLDEDLALLQEVLDGKRDTYQVQKRYIHKGGYPIWVLLAVSCVRDAHGRVRYFISQILDITKQKEVDQAKTEFVSLASHQLRTPLTSINWYAEMLMDGDAGKLTEDQLTYIKEIYVGNQRMVDLVNALLNVSRIELGTFMVDPEKTDLAKMVDSVIGELAPTIESKALVVKKEYGQDVPEMMVDKKLMRIVFQNLLSNAAKYTPEKGTITVRLAVKDDTLEAQVQDTGLGIPASQRDKIFTKLFRADNVRAVDADGTGLGLYIVKSIIESSGGNVRFVSEEGKGTTFFVTLPLAGMKAREGSKPLEPTKLPSPKSDEQK